MRYSVYNYETRQYDYYEGTGPKGTHAGAPPVSGGRSQLGATVEQFAWRLPASAQKVGSGELPQGRVASTGRASSLGDFVDSDMVKWGTLAAIVYIGWSHLRRSR